MFDVEKVVFWYWGFKLVINIMFFVIVKNLNSIYINVILRLICEEGFFFFCEVYLELF